MREGIQRRDRIKNVFVEKEEKITCIYSWNVMICRLVDFSCHSLITFSMQKTK